MYFEENLTIEEKLEHSNERIRRKLKLIRNKKNDSQEKLALSTKLHKSTISKFEKGNQQIPAAYIPIFADRYKVKSEYFFIDEDSEYGLDILTECIEQCMIGNDERRWAMEYMGQLKDRAVKELGYTKILDLIYTIFIYAGSGVVRTELFNKTMSMIMEMEENQSMLVKDMRKKKK